MNKLADGSVMYILAEYPVPSQTFVSNEVDELKRRGYTIDVFCCRDSEDEWRRSRHGAAYSRLGPAIASHAWFIRRHPMLYLRFLCESLRLGSLSVPFMLLLAPLAARRAIALQISQLHTHFHGRASALAKGVQILTGLPRSVTLHASDIYVHSEKLRRCCAGATVLTISNFNREYLLNCGIRSQLVPCGVSRLYLDVGGQDSYTAPTTDVLCVARLVEKKGVEVLVRATRMARDELGAPFSVKVIGTGPLATSLQRLASQLGLGSDLQFLGSLEPVDVVRALVAARLFVLPCIVASDGDADGIPVALLEAMACGVPVVSTRVTGIPELVNDNTGWLVDAGSVEQLCKTIVMALASPAEAKRRAIRARDLVTETRTIEHQVDGLIDSWKA